MQVQIDVDIAVRVGPIVLYRSALKGREVWRDGAFVSLESETSDDGTRHRVKAMRTSENVVVEVLGAPRTILPTSAISFMKSHSCWRPSSVRISTPARSITSERPVPE